MQIIKNNFLITKNKTFIQIFFFFLLADSILPTEIPKIKEVKESIRKSDLIILDKNNKPLHEIRNDRESRRLDWVSLENISAAVLKLESCCFIFESYALAREVETLLNTIVERTPIIVITIKSSTKENPLDKRLK
jgi:hypothetical protein